MQKIILLQTKKEKKIVEIKNKADGLIYSVEKNMLKLKNTISDSEKESINKKISDLKKSISDEDIDKVNTLIESLTQDSVKLSQYSSKNENSKTEDKGEEKNGENKKESANSNKNSKEYDDKTVVDTKYEKVNNKEEKNGDTVK